MSAAVSPITRGRAQHGNGQIHRLPCTPVEPDMAELFAGDIELRADRPDPINTGLPTRYRAMVRHGRGASSLGNLCFQRGSALDGRNGLSEDAVLAVLLHRLGAQAHTTQADEAIELLERARGLLRRRPTQ